MPSSTGKIFVNTQKISGPLTVTRDVGVAAAEHLAAQLRDRVKLGHALAHTPGHTPSHMIGHIATSGLELVRTLCLLNHQVSDSHNITKKGDIVLGSWI